MKIVPNIKIKIGFKFYSPYYDKTYIIFEKLISGDLVRFKYKNTLKEDEEFEDWEDNIKLALDSNSIRRV